MTSRKYEDPDTVEDSAVLSMHMLPGRPLDWAVGTDFDPLWDDKNAISIKLTLPTKSSIQAYCQLINWISYNVNIGEAKAMSAKDAALLWKGIQECVNDCCHIIPK
jgi:hypothetical protein